MIGYLVLLDGRLVRSCGSYASAQLCASELVGLIEILDAVDSQVVYKNIQEGDTV